MQAGKDKKPTSKRAALRASRVRKLGQYIAPTFGVSPLVLFPFMSGCIVLCAYDAVPFGLSELWLIPLLALFLGYFATQKRRQDRRAALGIVSDREVLALIAKEMPAWYSGKDVETMTWLNSVLASLWPYVDQGVSDNLTEEVVPPLIEGLVPGLRLELTKLTLGSVAPKITSVRASHASKSEVLLDLELKWSSDVYALLEVGFKLAPFTLELLDITFSGKLRVKLSPLIPYSPYIGAIQLAFLEKPHIDFRFKLAGLDAMSLQVPGLLDVANTVTNAIKGALQGLMVYPTHLVIPLADDEALASMELTKPPPRGVLRFCIVEAKNLPRMDSGGLPGISKLTTSDPYVEARCGPDGKKGQFKTEKIQKNLNPSK
jgi:Ca2+-dependent lipid-binding protein